MTRQQQTGLADDGGYTRAVTSKHERFEFKGRLTGWSGTRPHSGQKIRSRGQPPESAPAAFFSRVDTLHVRVDTLKKSLNRWSDVIGQRATEAVEEMSIFTDVVDVKVETLHTEVNLLKEVVGREHVRVDTLQKSLNRWSDVIGQRATEAVEEMSIFTDVVDVKVETLHTEVNLLKEVVGREEDRVPASKVKVSDPKPFVGVRSAKELKNFLWDTKIYFQAARIPKAKKISITSMYVIGDAKLWWCTRLSNNASANRGVNKMWDVLKKELKGQFFPCNTS
ncbi:hypothetical protein Sango_2109600 [Sesamum angolense]|uniref:Retrotransposon gag domain-containing protein n=1 Tax=Sesamum angolense TaxID=2727404 RepID=A0AAE1WBR5_9LAMI|nr:hypothetical protein Sango_2109600 [Sesamum angolense]